MDNGQSTWGKWPCMRLRPLSLYLRSSSIRGLCVKVKAGRLLASGRRGQCVSDWTFSPRTWIPWDNPPAKRNSVHVSKHSAYVRWARIVRGELLTPHYLILRETYCISFISPTIFEKWKGMARLAYAIAHVFIFLLSLTRVDSNLSSVFCLTWLSFKPLAVTTVHSMHYLEGRLRKPCKIKSYSFCLVTRYNDIARVLLLSASYRHGLNKRKT